MDALLRAHPHLALAEPALNPSPVIHIRGRIDSAMARRVTVAIRDLNAVGAQMIVLVITSPGGYTVDLQSIRAALEASPATIATIVPSYAYSSAAILFASGADGHRYMAPDAKLMIHDIGLSFDGVPSVKCAAAQVQDATAEFERHMRILGGASGKGAEFFRHLVRDTGFVDTYISAADALAYGLANHLHIPALRATVTLDLALVEPAEAITSTVTHVLPGTFEETCDREGESSEEEEPAAAAPESSASTPRVRLRVAPPRRKRGAKGKTSGFAVRRHLRRGGFSAHE